MSNLGSSMAKVAMLAGGAVLGAYIARLCEDWLASRARTQSDYDKKRYEQGLSAVVLPPVAPPQTPYQAANAEEQQQYNEFE